MVQRSTWAPPLGLLLIALDQALLTHVASCEPDCECAFAISTSSENRVRVRSRTNGITVGSLLAAES